MSIYCYACDRPSEFTVELATDAAPPLCPSCGQNGFVEVLSHQPRPRANAQGPVPQQGGQSRSWTINLPGSRGTVRIMTSTSSTVQLPSGSASPTDFVASMQGILGPLLSSGFVNPASNPIGGLHVPSANMQEEQEWLDQIITRLMEQHQPQARRTARRVLDSLPNLKIRSADATGEPGEGEAQCKAGECCTICTEAYIAGNSVMELPCSHCYHKDCIMPWLQDHNTCPVCRLELPSEDTNSSSGTTSQQQQGTSNNRPAAAPASSSRTQTQRPQQQTITNPSMHDVLNVIASAWERHASRDQGNNNTQGSQEGQQQPQPSIRRRRTSEQQGGNAPPAASSPQGGGNSSVDPRAAAAEAAERRARGEPSQSSRPTTPPERQFQSERTQPAENEDEGRDNVMGALGVVAGGAIGALAGRLIAGWLRSGR